jgi:hypothetical protein
MMHPCRSPLADMPTPPTRSPGSLGYRVSVSLTEDQHEFLTALAERKRVSLAWVVRDAIEQLIAQQSPLFSGKQSREDAPQR